MTSHENIEVSLQTVKNRCVTISSILSGKISKIIFGRRLKKKNLNNEYSTLSIIIFQNKSYQWREDHIEDIKTHTEKWLGGNRN